MLAHAFSGDVGEKALSYLKSITLNVYNGPNIDPNNLMHLEGQRFIVGVIQRRIQDARRGYPENE